jgi:hypothetical protein
MKFDIRIFVVSASLGLAGCQIYPYNYQEFSNTTSPITFMGCDTVPNEPVEFDAYVHSLSIPIGNAKTAASVTYTDSAGANWYCWDQTATIPSNWWIPGLGGFVAAVTTRQILNGGQELGSGFWYYNNDPKQCPQPAGSAQFTNSAPCALQPSGWVDWMTIKADAQ